MEAPPVCRGRGGLGGRGGSPQSHTPLSLGGRCPLRAPPHPPPGRPQTVLWGNRFSYDHRCPRGAALACSGAILRKVRRSAAGHGRLGPAAAAMAVCVAIAQLEMKHLNKVKQCRRNRQFGAATCRSCV